MSSLSVESALTLVDQMTYDNLESFKRKLMKHICIVKVKQSYKVYFTDNTSKVIDLLSIDEEIN